MAHGSEKGRPHFPHNGGGRDDGDVTRRRSRPSRQVPVSVVYRSQTKEEVQLCIDALQLLVSSLVRKRMGGQEEDET